ncbi:MAG TPA: hypothetical protein VMP11_20100 [Verrucomicrobiae bacterium]|nr:hypothetical protein [Verrucomicrobiae bacterium]
MGSQRFISRAILAAAIVLSLCPVAVFAAVSADILVDPKSPGATNSPDFIGLSYEMSLVGATTDGEHFFSAANKPLVNMFQTLGVRSLRVGGNTAERSTVKVPDKADIDSLFGFARAAGVKVIYTLRLSDSNTVAAAQTAKYIMDNYRPELTCFALGNEPDKLVGDSQAYNQMAREYIAAITSSSNAPDAVFCGPGTMHKDVQWANDFAKDFARDKHVLMVTQHQYPAASGRVATNIPVACAKLLSTNLVSVYQKLYDTFVPSAQAAGLRYRLEEANSYSNGGAAGSSDAYAAAVWGLDYMYWWATHGAAGINFHTAGYAPGASHPSSPARYVVFWNSPDGFRARPLAYAIKAFDLSSHGQFVPVHFNSNADQVNLTAYGVLSSDGGLYITLVNKDATRACDANITLANGDPYAHANAMFLTGPNGDITATAGTTLGGAAIKDDGSWSGTWTPLAAKPDKGHFLVSLPAASAAIVRITR